VAELQPQQRDLSRQALFQVMFALHNMQLIPLELPGLTLLPLSTEHTSAKFDLRLDFFETEDGLWGRMEYATDLFRRSTIERLTQSYQQVLQAVAEDAAGIGEQSRDGSYEEDLAATAY
jgi:non-ribosomal peptide synthetase component F